MGDETDQNELYNMLCDAMDEKKDVDKAELARKIDGLPPSRAKIIDSLILTHAKLYTKGKAAGEYPYGMKQLDAGKQLDIGALPTKLLAILDAYIMKTEEGDVNEEE